MAHWHGMGSGARRMPAAGLGGGEGPACGSGGARESLTDEERARIPRELPGGLIEPA